jgi:hypothetical protein
MLIKGNRVKVKVQTGNRRRRYNNETGVVARVSGLASDADAPYIVELLGSILVGFSRDELTKLG